ncbi:MAG: hypothetical protein IIY31_06305, partial [Desulfovibrio sp.]|nr:hypothetical protein [Desulfovibrio sp.]
EPVQSFHRRGDHQVQIDLKGDSLTVLIDVKEGPKNLAVPQTGHGNVFLGASWQGEAWSQRNLADDVYDAVFEKFTILTNIKEDIKDEKVLFTTELTGFDKFLFRANELWESVLFWFLRNA